MDKTRPRILEPHLPDDITVKHWIGLYSAYFLVLIVPLILLVGNEPWAWSDWIEHAGETFARTSVPVKLLVMGLYVSMACTFLPLPTGWIIAGLATREAALANGASDSVLIVALLTTLTVSLAGSIGSTMANLNDYHIFTWMLRHHRIAAVRQTRTYQSAAKWFSRAPFFLIVLFNIIPIPVDFVRLLATTYRYPRAPFAAANFVGRFIRYAAIAFVTFWWDLGAVAPIALLALAAALGLGRVGPRLISKLLSRNRRTAIGVIPNIRRDRQEQRG